MEARMDRKQEKLAREESPEVTKLPGGGNVMGGDDSFAAARARFASPPPPPPPLTHTPTARLLQWCVCSSGYLSVSIGVWSQYGLCSNSCHFWPRSRHETEPW